MHLIAPLMAGVAGAESGSVILYRRGTTTLATYYTSFEGDGGSAPASIALDANGGATVYVNELVRVIVRNSAGATVRDFVDGVSAPAVEVRSTSFNGAAYSGGAIAPGNPTTLKAILDLWLTSAGAPDFEVLVNGVAAPIETALAAVSGLGLYVVTSPTYGAEGDGSTDDTAAIQAAINAANAAGGGVVFFPAGTYRCASALTTYATVTLRGVDRARSVIRIDHNASEHFVGAAPAACEDLGFTLNVARTFPVIDIVDGSTTRFSRCRFNAGVATGSFLGGSTTYSYVTVESCEFMVTAATFTGNLVKVFGQLTMSGCVFRVSGTSYTGTVVEMVGDGSVTGCMFNLVTVTSGTSTVVQPNNNGAMSGCSFSCQSTACTYLGVSAGAFSESGNVYSFPSGAAVAFASSAYDTRQLGSRALRTITVADSGATLNATIDALSFGNYRLQMIGVPAGNFNLNFTHSPVASLTVLAIHNDTASSITFAWGTNHAMSGTTFAVAANSFRCFLLQYVDFNGSTVCKYHTVSDTAGAQENE